MTVMTATINAVSDYLTVTIKKTLYDTYVSTQEITADNKCKISIFTNIK